MATRAPRFPTRLSDADGSGFPSVRVPGLWGARSDPKGPKAEDLRSNGGGGRSRTGVRSNPLLTFYARSPELVIRRADRGDPSLLMAPRTILFFVALAYLLRGSRSCP